MKISLIYCYKEIKENLDFAEELVKELQLQNNVVDCYAVKDFSSKYFFKLDVKLLESTSVISEKDMQKLMDEIYKNMNSINSDAYLVPINDWKILKAIDRSYLQLTNKNVLFVIDKVDKEEKEDLESFADHLYRYRNVHIGLCSSVWNVKLYNLHFLQGMNLQEILKLHIENRRKYIGWKHSANELRQKIKFNKDLLKHRLMVMFNNPYKEKQDSSDKIPKVIHYCWFGGKPMPEKIKKFVDSWKNILPEYEFKCWNESNFPIEKYYFAKEAYAKKKWAFIADIARLHALYYEGGIYLDTDVEVLKDFDSFLHHDVFVTYGPLNHVCMSTIGAKKHNPWIAELLLWYECVHCDDDYTEIANAKIVTKINKLHYKLKNNGELITLPCGVTIYPEEYFLPKQTKDGYLVTNNTHCIHHFSGLW